MRRWEFTMRDGAGKLLASVEVEAVGARGILPAVRRLVDPAIFHRARTFECAPLGEVPRARAA